MILNITFAHYKLLLQLQCVQEQLNFSMNQKVTDSLQTKKQEKTFLFMLPLFDVTNGSGSFTFEGRELFYTVKQEILYDKSTQQVIVFYKKGSDFSPGLHQVEVYTNEYKMGNGTFTVK
jgi:outer membrane usher protein FimD/PapC